MTDANSKEVFIRLQNIKEIGKQMNSNLCGILDPIIQILSMIKT